MKCKSQSFSSASRAVDAVGGGAEVVVGGAGEISCFIVGAGSRGLVSGSAGNFSNRCLNALKRSRALESSFAFPRFRPRVDVVGIMDSRAETFFSGAWWFVVVPRFMEAFSWAISAFVLSRALGFRVSGSGEGVGVGEEEGEARLGGGAGGCFSESFVSGGEGDLEGEGLRIVFSRGFDCSGAFGKVGSLRAFAGWSPALVKFGFTLAFLTTGALASSPSSAPKLNNVFVALRFFLGALVGSGADVVATEACFTISLYGFRRTSVDVI